MGYWNDPEQTAERFRPVPGASLQELAVWSGDRVRRDASGYLYFVARQDEMIKTSGYRVSPTEVEQVVSGSGITHAVAVGVPHSMLGQVIVLVAQASDATLDEQTLLERCQRELPAYMVPAKVYLVDTLPHTPNGKIDRAALAARYRGLFQ
jgi:acyl-coenzyme A synthetase/AMP-(fatty) acid ligase